MQAKKRGWILINHLAMVTGNMEATIRFWRDLIGMRLIKEIGKDGFRHYFFEIIVFDHIAFGSHGRCRTSAWEMA